MSCSLCDNPNTREVRVALAEWRHPIDGERWTAIPRCIDRVACRERLERRDEEWPLVKSAA